MNDERWSKIEQIFNQAVLISEDKRSAFVRQNCLSNQNLQAEIFSLLNADGASDSIFEEPAVMLLTHLLDEDNAFLRENSEFASYKLKKLLGRGGMGAVFLGEDKSLERPVAIKVLPSTLAGSQERVQRFRQEAKAASAISHPNLAHVYEFGLHNEFYYLAMEFVSGKTLRDLIREKAVDLPGAIAIALQTANALDAAHNAGIVHRDVKPENIIVTADGLVKVLDFGLAKLNEKRRTDEPENSLKTTPGLIIGTTAYMSPEQIRGAELDKRTDLWSLGVVLHEMLTGRRPFYGDTASDIQAAILLNEAPPLLIANEQLPELDRIVRKALVKDVATRYQTALELISDLRYAQRRVYDFVQRHADLKTNRQQTFPTDNTRIAEAANASVNLAKAPKHVVFGKQFFAAATRRSYSIFAALALTALTGAIFWRQTVSPPPDSLNDDSDATALFSGENRKDQATPVSSSLDQVYLSARRRLSNSSTEERKKCVEEFVQATVSNPNFAPAYSGLATAHILHGNNIYGELGLNAAGKSFPTARESANQALRLDPESDEALAALAFLKYNFEYNWTAAEENFKRALKINPNNVLAMRWYAEMLHKSGRFEQGFSEQRRALLLAPDSPEILNEMAWGAYLARDFAAAIDYVEKAHAKNNSEKAAALYNASEIYEQKGDSAGAFALWKQAMTLESANRKWIQNLETSFNQDGAAGFVRAKTEWLENLSEKDYVYPTDLAKCYTALGKNDKALESLEKAVKAHAPDVASVKYAAAFDKLRGDQRFQKILQQLNYPQKTIVQ